MTEEIQLEANGLTAQVVSVSRQYRDTLEHTGLMCWESSVPLARFLLAAASLTQGAFRSAAIHTVRETAECMLSE